MLNKEPKQPLEAASQMGNVIGRIEPKTGEPPVPWEFRIHKFEGKPITDMERGKMMFNYWFHDEQSGKLTVGYHGKDETSEYDYGELLPDGRGGYLFLYGPQEVIPEKIRNTLREKVIEDMRKQGYRISGVTMQSSNRAVA